MTGTSEGRICDKTGLKLIPSSSRIVWRVARTSYGALNPKMRDPAEVSRQQWGRWDPPGERTIYASEHPTGSYLETLAWSRPTKDEPAEKYFTDAEPGETILEAIAADWAVEGTMCLWSVPASWREDRNLYELGLPDTGWLVDVTDSESLSRLTVAFDLPEPLTLAHLAGEERDLTTKIGQWVRSQELFDGSSPIGIAYRSRFGTNHRCYALWLAPQGDTERIEILSEAPIDGGDAKYQSAARQLRVTAH